MRKYIKYQKETIKKKKKVLQASKGGTKDEKCCRLKFFVE